MTEPMRVVGTMSGTSLDGVDAAEIVTDGETISGFGATAYRPYAPAERAVLAAALGLWQGPEVAAAALATEAAHCEILSNFADAELVGFHGQTLAHEPRGRGTLQAGNGERLARALDCPVAWDFRSADVVAGGQGAPLAPFFHFACARWMKAEAPIAFLNLGGVANLTLVDPSAEAPEADRACFALDTGPANAPIDDLMRSRTGSPRDEGGATALAGRPDDRLVKQVLAMPYFTAPPPKSLDRNDFREALLGLDRLPLEDAAATLVDISAGAVALALAACPLRPARILVTGGGRHNAAMMRAIGARCAAPVEAIEVAGLDGDMLEAQAFGYLAARVLRGLPLSAPGTTGVPAPCPGGRIAKPRRMAA